MPQRVLAVVLVVCAACATAPPPTAAARRIAKNPRATVEGRVTDARGQPVPGVRVEAVPGGKDVLWSPAAATDAQGRFHLSLDAPADYVFLIYVDGVAALTASPRDPGRVRISVNPGDRKTGVELTLLPVEREKLIEPGP